MFEELFESLHAESDAANKAIRDARHTKSSRDVIKYREQPLKGFFEAIKVFPLPPSLTSMLRRRLGWRYMCSRKRCLSRCASSKLEKSSAGWYKCLIYSEMMAEHFGVTVLPAFAGAFCQTGRGAMMLRQEQTDREDVLI